MPPRPPRPDVADQRPDSIGALLTELRHHRGYSQLRLAELLCAAANVSTVSRHEVSRWEREERVPGAYWLGWLAAVLEVPLDRLEEAAALARPRVTATRKAGRPAPDSRSLWRPPSAAELLTELDHATAELRELAHVWLAGPPDPSAARAAGPASIPAATAPGPGPPDPVPLDELGARLRRLRRTDDLVGGADLARRVDDELRAALALLRCPPGPLRRRALRLIAEFAQLSGWVQADAGDRVAARRAYRVALRAAAAGADRALAAHVLGSLSHLCLAGGDPQQALLLARTGHAGARRSGSALLRALLQHRVAFAAARVGERRAADLALADAERLAERADRAREPDWLYWLDEPELLAMSGRCLAAMGRPLRAESGLRQAGRPRAGPRTAALYGGWLARTYLCLGEVEQACAAATAALLDAVRAGSVRAAAGLRRLEWELSRRAGDVPAARGYRALVAAATGYLPDPAGAGLDHRRSRPA
jgi:transcriptional regulator with XRE-family HTH domain